MPESIPKTKPGTAVTCHAAVAVVGGRFVAVVGEPVGGSPQVGAPAAGERVFGVTATDAIAGTKVGVHGAAGQIVPVEAGALLAAGAFVTPSAAGTALVAGVGQHIAGQITEGAAAGAQALLRLAYLGTGP